MRPVLASLRSRRWVRRLLIALAVFLLLVGMGAVGLRTLLARQQALESSASIHQVGYVRIGGIPQWIEIRGWDRTNPVILWLHGGPGAPVLPASYASFLPWEKTFTIAHWHQRGAGLTYAATPGNPSPLTIDRMVQDGIEVAEHVRSRLRKDKVILIGHSWGSVIGTRMVQRRPDLFAAYVGTGQFNSLEDDGRDLFAAAMARAKASGDARAIESLTAVSSLPLTDVGRMNVVRKWGKSEDISDNPMLVLLAPLISPGYPLRKAFSLGNAFEVSRRALFDEEKQVRGTGILQPARILTGELCLDQDVHVIDVSVPVCVGVHGGERLDVTGPGRGRNRNVSGRQAGDAPGALSLPS